MQNDEEEVTAGSITTPEVTKKQRKPRKTQKYYLFKPAHDGKGMIIVEDVPRTSRKEDIQKYLNNVENSSKLLEEAKVDSMQLVVFQEVGRTEIKRSITASSIK